MTISVKRRPASLPKLIGVTTDSGIVLKGPEDKLYHWSSVTGSLTEWNKSSTLTEAIKSIGRDSDVRIGDTLEVRLGYES